MSCDKMLKSLSSVSVLAYHKEGNDCPKYNSNLLQHWDKGWSHA